jgi:hypothetical protein
VKARRIDAAKSDTSQGRARRPPAPARRAGPPPGAAPRWPTPRDRSQHSRSGECRSSHTHKTVPAPGRACRCWGCGGDARGRRGRTGRRPRFPQSHPTADRKLLRGEPADSRSDLGPP